MKARISKNLRKNLHENGLGESPYHPFRNHYTHKITFFELFRSLQLQFSGPTGIIFHYSYSFVGLTGICLYSYSSGQLHKKMVFGIIFENCSYSYIKNGFRIKNVMISKRMVLRKTQEGCNCRFQRTPRTEDGAKVQGGVDPRFPASLPFPVRKIFCSISRFRKFLQHFSRNDPAIFLGKPRRDPGNSHSFLKFSDLP